MDQNHLGNFSREHYEKHLCDLILNLGQWLMKKCRLKKKFTHAATAFGSGDKVATSCFNSQ